MNVLITGSTGFVGREIIKSRAGNSCLNILAVARRLPENPIPTIDYKTINSINADTVWDLKENSVDVIIHCAARAHVLNETTIDPLSEFRRVNVEGTINLAKQALVAGVRRFVFISSIGVNGNRTGLPFSEKDEPNPVEPYAISKLEAEIGLWTLLAGTGMELVIIRPPLVYGPNAPGNFRRLIHAVAKGIPLPLGAIQNKRSLVALDNLVDLIWTCVNHPAAANQIFLAGDGEDLSTTELLQRMAIALRVPSRLIPIPQGMVSFAAKALGKADIAQRLCGSLQVDISKAREVLGWRPPVSVDDALLKTARAFLSVNDL